MSDKDIQDLLEEGLGETGTIEKAIDYILEEGIRDLFEMDKHDEPEFTELVIPFKGVDYKIEIYSDGCIEATGDHTIMDWRWIVTPLN